MRHVGAHEVSGASMVIRPNRSLPVVGVAILFVALSSFVSIIGIMFTLAGAWVVLPFAVIQIVAVGFLCRWLYRHVDDCELVLIEPERVRVIKRHGRRTSQHDFARHWVRARVDRDGDGTNGRLRIGSHGRFVNLADEVNEADRLLVARELVGLLRSS